MSEKPHFSRRRLLQALWAGVLALAAWPVLRFATWREPRVRTVVFGPQELQASGVLYKDEVFLLPAAEPAVALSARCAHLGCLVSFVPAAGEFRCPCHQSVYDRLGQRMAGPAQRGLAQLPVRELEDGGLAVEAPV